jgi:hypothetical protein
VLTTGADDLTGTAGRDKFVATVSSLAGTLQATDKIDGGEGNDRLEVAMDIAFTGFTTGSVKNVETIMLTNNGATSREFNASGITGAKTFSIDATNGAVTLAGLPTGVETISLKSQSGSTSGTTFTSAYVAGAPEQSSSTTAVTLGVDGVGTSTTARVTATLADVQALTVDAAGSNFLSIGGTQATSLKITGSGDLNTTVAASSAIRTVDGSAATGALTLDLTGVAPATTSAGISSIKTGSGADSVTVAMEDLKANATIDTGAGTDTVNLSNATSPAANLAVAYSLPGVETLAIGSAVATSDLTFSALGWSDIGTISVKGGTSGHTQSAVTVAGLGARAITANVLGSTVTAANLSVDNSGAGVLNFKADSTAAKAGTGVDAPVSDVTFTQASSLTANVEAYVAPTVDVGINADKATSVTLDVASGKNSAGTELTAFYGTIDAPEATSLTVNSQGILGATGAGNSVVFTAPKATSVNLTNGASAGFATLTTNSTGGALKDLTLTSGAALTVTGGHTDALSKVQNLTIAANKGLVSFATSTDFVAASTVTLSGSGTGSSVTLGDLGTTTNGYDLTVNASGTLAGTTSTHGVTIGNISVANGKNVTLNLATVTGSIDIGTIGADADHPAGNVTILAGLAGSSSSAKSDGGFIVEAITATGAVNIDAKNAKQATIGSEDSTTITGDSVTIDLSGVEASTYTLGDISIKSAATIKLNALAEADAFKITGQSTSTALNVDVTGGINAEIITVTGTGANVAAITLAGDLNAGTDSVTVNGGGSKAKSISLAGLLNYENSTIIGSTGNDTIVGGAGADRIEIFGGVNSITGGAGADVFFFQAGTSNYTKVNTITDFSATDSIVFDVASTTIASAISDANKVTVGTSSAGAGGVSGAIGAVTVAAGAAAGSTTGVAAFTSSSASGFDTLAKKVGILSDTFDTAGDTVFFADSGNTYVFVSGGTATDATNDLVVQLVGVALPTVSAPTTSDTGLLGFGS